MTALLISLAVYPGAGQIYNRQVAKGVVFAVLFTVPMVGVLWILARAAAIFMGAVTTLGEPPDLVAMLKPGIPWAAGCAVVYAAAAWDAWRGAARE